MAKVTTYGDRVKLKRKDKECAGVVKFIGEIKGQKGIFYGVELDGANTGDNNGNLGGVIYFVTNKRKGVFIKKSAILKTNDKQNERPRVSVGTKVSVTQLNSHGEIKFIGETSFKPGVWYGILLDEAKGKNNGSVKGRSYFQCGANHGTFLKESEFEIAEKNRKVSSTSSRSISDGAHRRRDIEKVVNVLNGNGNTRDITAVIESYDDKKENDDIAWLKIIATLKNVYDKMSRVQPVVNVDVDGGAAAAVETAWLKIIATLKNVYDKMYDKMSRVQMDVDGAQQQQQLKQQVDALQSELEALRQQQSHQTDSATTTTKNEFERRLKFETAQLSQQYEDQIRTLTVDKQRLEQQVVKLKTLSNYVEPSESEKEQQLNDEEKDALIASLQSDKEQLLSTSRSKDEIVEHAKKEIERLQKEVRALREEEEKEELQLDNLQKDRARELLQARVQQQQRNSLTPSAAGGPQKTISELLNESSKEDAVDIIYSMNVLSFVMDRKLKRQVYELNLNNNAVLMRLTNTQRVQFLELLAYCICDDSGQQKIERVCMTNLGVLDDKLFVDFMDILLERLDKFHAFEWNLESNKIGDEGMKKIAEFVRREPHNLEILKLTNNKKQVNTQVLKELIGGIEENKKLQYFYYNGSDMYGWRLKQYYDRCEKHLRANQNAKRKAFIAGKK
eukprot:CAMPEP_0202728708 /NCGR_PEP_ID=MMETSP1385-20130828/185761_1 /ASSEMBLY_ACC=CAM_ASM_000861 /TAXON_ID=933848 /ORGANISM="Elphidium margaritaceum" /LENGTH=674 /DNA_ID=CAMNT_0049394959 /DNA_START=18 /DNA_END=2041 /DNA_ORIENTATION=-